MFRDEMVTRIALLLGKRADMNTSIIAELKAQQARLEEAAFLPFFILAEEYQILFSAIGDEAIALPDDFIRESEDEVLWLFNPVVEPDKRWTVMEKAMAPELKRRLKPSGTPSAYAIAGSQLMLGPTPDAVYEFKWKYYQHQPTLDTNIENAWMKHAPLLLGGLAGITLATALGNATALATFSADVQEQTKRLSDQDTARTEAAQDRTMGEAP